MAFIVVPLACRGVRGRAWGYRWRARPERTLMPDERNVAHDKKVQHDKEDRGEEVAPGAAVTPQPGRKPKMEEHASDDGPNESAG
jgi:hypothetical protein